jgi:hypothetical protein
LIIDLCSSIGRFESDEEVIRVDFDIKTKPDICADIRYLPFRPGLKVRHVHASPPCEYVSKARRWAYGWNPKGIAESLELVAACYEAFAYLGAENCSLENPAGLEEILGHKVQFQYDKYDIKNATTNFYLNKKAQKRALIPKDVRQQILAISDNQMENKS